MPRSVSDPLDVLIVEDSPTQREAYRLQIEARAHHWRVQTAATGAAALSACRGELPDCLILDHELPDTTGVEVLRELRRRYEANALAVVILTERGSEEVAVDAMKLGAQDYLRKSAITPSELVDRVGAAVERVRLMQSLARQTTELVRRTDELQQARAEVERANERLHALQDKQMELFAAIAHDVRGPMHVIRGALGEVRDAALGELGGERGQLLDIADRAARRLVDLADELSDLVQLEEGEITLSRERVDLGSLALDLVEEFRHSATGARRVIHLDVEESVPATVDRRRMARVFSNLLSNGLRHARAEVSVIIRRAGGEAVITVEDDGAGIDPDILPRLFERFVRGKGADGGRMGLGLAIVRGFVEAHGGVVHADNRGTMGGGARFELRVPDAAVRPAASLR